MTKEGMIRVWDPLVRVFHWALVAAFALAWLTAEEWDAGHEAIGYVAAGLIAVRVAWGFTGPHYARFAQFVRAPDAVVGYLRDIAGGREKRYLGHNPAAGAMVVALLLAIGGTCWTGWLMAEPSRIAALPEAPAIVAAAWADSDNDERKAGGRRSAAEERFEETHEFLANLSLLLVALHVGGVALASRRHHENLPLAMVTGDKRAPGPDDVA
jgi:cytochrome b